MRDRGYGVSVLFNNPLNRRVMAEVASIGNAEGIRGDEDRQREGQRNKVSRLAEPVGQPEEVQSFESGQQPVWDEELKSYVLPEVEIAAERPQAMQDGMSAGEPAVAASVEEDRAIGGGKNKVSRLAEPMEFAEVRRASESAAVKDSEEEGLAIEGKRYENYRMAEPIMESAGVSRASVEQATAVPYNPTSERGDQVENAEIYKDVESAQTDILTQNAPVTLDGSSIGEGKGWFFHGADGRQIDIDSVTAIRSTRDGDPYLLVDINGQSPVPVQITEKQYNQFVAGPDAARIAVVQQVTDLNLREVKGQTQGESHTLDMSADGAALKEGMKWSGAEKGSTAEVGRIWIHPDEAGKGYSMTAVINGEEVTHSVSEREMEKFLAMNDDQRLRLFDKIFPEMKMQNTESLKARLTAGIEEAVQKRFTRVSEKIDSVKARANHAVGVLIGLESRKDGLAGLKSDVRAAEVGKIAESARSLGQADLGVSSGFTGKVPEELIAEARGEASSLFDSLAEVNSVGVSRGR